MSLPSSGDQWPAFQTTTADDTNISLWEDGNGTAIQVDDDLYQVPTGAVVFLSLCYGTISVVAVVGNVCVLWIVASSRRMRTVTNLFVANLAVADVIIGVFAIPFQFQAALLQRWLLPVFMCGFCPFVQVLSVTVSVCTLTVIALDRYRAVVHPLRARSSKSKARVVVIFIWLLAALASGPFAYALRVTMIPDTQSGVNATKPFCHNVGIEPVTWQVYNHTLVAIQYFLPLCLICFAYLRMGVELNKAKAPGNAQTVRDANILKNKRKVIKMFFTVVAMFAICWLPFQTYNVLQDIFPEINNFKYINVIWFFCHWLAMSSSCCNPFIYAIYNEKFKQEVRGRFPGLFKSQDSRQMDTQSQEFSASFRYG